MKKIMCLGFVLVITNTFSQDLLNEFGNAYYTPDLYKTNYSYYEGSPYLNDSFVPAKINDIRETQLVRFDAYEGNVEVKLSKSRIVILENAKNYLIALKDGSGRIYETLDVAGGEGKSISTFLEIVHQDQYFKLYRQEVIRYSKEKKAEAYKEAEPASFKKSKEIYYIQDLKSNSSYPEVIPQRLKDFLVVFPNNSKDLRTYIKKERLRLDQADDLITIFKYYFTAQLD